MTLFRILLAFLLITGVSSPVSAQRDMTAEDAVRLAIEAHGGDLFFDPGTLQLSGIAEFYDPATGEVRSRSDNYRMWREFERGRTVAHGADGKVRILALDGERTIFEVGYDGETTWTQDGIMPRDLADAYWASNFGFGIIRSALDEGFALSFAPPRDIAGRETQIIRISDPQGQETLFGIDAETDFLTYMAFRSLRGFHERIYGNFLHLPESGWVQARSVALLYDGVVANRVYWETVVVGAAIDPDVFTPPATRAP